MNLISKDTAILITAYTGGNDPEYFKTGNDSIIHQKRYMAKTLAKYLKETGYYVCLSSHSTLDEETQRYCHSFIYDSDNRWQIDGVPNRPNHGVAEMTAIHNGLNVLSRYGFKNVLKLCYDQHPDLNYKKLIGKFESMNKKLITLQDAYGVGTLCFFADIQFLKDTLSMNEIWRCESAVERAWLGSIRDKGLENQLYGYSSYDEMLELPQGSPHHFASLQQDGTVINEYNY
jgi:hypothetical protein